MIIFLLVLLGLVSLLSAYVNTPQGKGKVGELFIKIELGKTKPGEKYIINNLMIEGENGKTSQIDHILINKNGVYVIETKNYSGRIYGKDNQLQWTQVLNYGKVKNHFYNPVKQNATHIYRINEALKEDIYLNSIIVFTQGNTQYIESDKVYTISQMKRFIKQPQKQTLTVEKMEEIHNKLLNIKHNTHTTTKQHIENINQTLEDTQNGICPRCGGQLVERKGQHGTFYGCSNYPNCKFTKK